jgi:hypothetical protein
MGSWLQSEISLTACDLERKTNNFDKPIGLFGFAFSVGKFISCIQERNLKLNFSYFTELPKKYIVKHKNMTTRSSDR